ncbi:NETI motif-containing protein [Fictibacillus sp. KIGAM418]|uniref:NETI motif-containing protein n=1 Tax=Fictibacillus marinisediminis TaxID=2878389 RepID=A0A9X1X7B2_9BACL|nr:NETI motif-containing protein [Fictibacillus marinisediminis]MCK6255362.1 NETI motif-containing protein [Fictibacillus marinisediminis]
MDKKPNKKKFEVQPGETISDCIDRMAEEGYSPVRRMEEPVFKEVKKNGKIEQEYHEQRIVFEGKIQ